jgi:hypothetical protein
MAGGVAQVVEHLPNKCKALTSNHQKKKKVHISSLILLNSGS